MNGDEADNEEEQHLNEFYPFREDGAPPPGEWANGRWIEKLGWRTRHGKAIVLWSLGKPSRVTHALYPDGTRGEVQSTQDRGHRRRSNGPLRWLYGTIDVRADDVIFVDTPEQPRYTPPPLTDAPNLEAELARDAPFLQSLGDDRFARTTYWVFRNREFLKGDDERRWICGDRSAARLVRDLRGLGESYQDYFPWTKVDGIWPDDRNLEEARLRKAIDAAARPPLVQPSFEGSWPGAEELRRRRAQDDANKPPMTPEQEQVDKEVSRRSQETYRAWIASRRQDIDARHKEHLENAQRALAKFYRDAQQNADTFAELHAHLTRLGWRTESAEDREKTARKAMQRAVEVLRDVKRLELRPEAVKPDWARPAEEALSREQKVMRISRVSEHDKMTMEEREARRVGNRLNKLAVSGRISKEEYETLQARLRGTLATANAKSNAKKAE
jgi:hypothetical protein